MSEPSTEPPPLPVELAELLRGNDQVRHACQAALRAAFQAGHDAGWAKGYTEGRAVTSALAHRSGCNLNHPAGEPCEVPADVGLRATTTAQLFTEAGGQQGFRSTSGGRVVRLPVTLRSGETVSFPSLPDGDYAVTRFPDGHVEWTEL